MMQTRLLYDPEPNQNQEYLNNDNSLEDDKFKIENSSTLPQQHHQNNSKIPLKEEEYPSYNNQQKTNQKLQTYSTYSIADTEEDNNINIIENQKFLQQQNLCSKQQDKQQTKLEKIEEQPHIHDNIKSQNNENSVSQKLQQAVSQIENQNNNLKTSKKQQNSTNNKQNTNNPEFNEIQTELDLFYIKEQLSILQKNISKKPILQQQQQNKSTNSKKQQKLQEQQQKQSSQPSLITNQDIQQQKNQQTKSVNHQPAIRHKPNRELQTQQQKQKNLEVKEQPKLQKQNSKNQNQNKKPKPQKTPAQKRQEKRRNHIFVQPLNIRKLQKIQQQNQKQLEKIDSFFYTNSDQSTQNNIDIINNNMNEIQKKQQPNNDIQKKNSNLNIIQKTYQNKTPQTNTTTDTQDDDNDYSSNISIEKSTKNNQQQLTNQILEKQQSQQNTIQKQPDQSNQNPINTEQQQQQLNNNNNQQQQKQSQKEEIEIEQEQENNTNNNKQQQQKNNNNKNEMELESDIKSNLEQFSEEPIQFDSTPLPLIAPDLPLLSQNQSQQLQQQQIQQQENQIKPLPIIKKPIKKQPKQQFQKRKLEIPGKPSNFIQIRALILEDLDKLFTIRQKNAQKPPKILANRYLKTFQDLLPIKQQNQYNLLNTTLQCPQSIQISQSLLQPKNINKQTKDKLEYSGLMVKSLQHFQSQLAEFKDQTPQQQYSHLNSHVTKLQQSHDTFLKNFSTLNQLIHNSKDINKYQTCNLCSNPQCLLLQFEYNNSNLFDHNNLLSYYRYYQNIPVYDQDILDQQQQQIIQSKIPQQKKSQKSTRQNNNKNSQPQQKNIPLHSCVILTEQPIRDLSDLSLTQQLDHKSLILQIKQLLQGLKHIHDKGYAHNNINSSSIFELEDLQSKKYVLKLGNFTYTRLNSHQNHSQFFKFFQKQIQEIPSIQHYLAPEILALDSQKQQQEFKICQQKSDLYSMGIIILELFLNQNLHTIEHQSLQYFIANNPELSNKNLHNRKIQQEYKLCLTNFLEQFKQPLTDILIQQNNLNMLENLWKIIQNMLIINPQQRYSLDLILKNSLFR